MNDIHLTEPISEMYNSTMDLPELDIYETLILFADIIDSGLAKLEMTNSSIFREAAREIERLRGNTATAEIVITGEDGKEYQLKKEQP